MEAARYLLIPAGALEGAHATLGGLPTRRALPAAEAAALAVVLTHAVQPAELLVAYAVRLAGKPGRH